MAAQGRNVFRIDGELPIFSAPGSDGHAMVWGMVPAFSRAHGLFDLSPQGADLDVYPNSNHQMAQIMKKVKALGKRARSQA
jgi:hypothetical protein